MVTIPAPRKPVDADDGIPAIDAALAAEMAEPDSNVRRHIDEMLRLNRQRDFAEYLAAQEATL